MKHVLFGGDGFVGRVLAAKLAYESEKVIVADIAKGDCPHYAKCEWVHLDVTKPEDFAKINIKPEDAIQHIECEQQV